MLFIHILAEYQLPLLTLMTTKYSMKRGLVLKGSILIVTVSFYLFITSVFLFFTIIYITPKLSGQIALFSIVAAMIPPSILTIFLLKRIIGWRFTERHLG